MEKIEKNIVDLLDNQGKDYLTFNALKNQKFLQTSLKLTKNMSNTDIKKKLIPHVGNEIRITNGYKGLYVTRNISDSDMVINSLQKKANSLGRLKLFFPVQTKKLLKLVAQMIMAGQLCVDFSANGTINLSINDNFEKQDDMPQNDVAIQTPKNNTQNTSERQPSNDRQKMKEAYDHVGGGRSFVRIYAMREYLAWPEKRFNQTLEQLTKDLAIQLHYGDPSVLTEKQLENSFVDDEGQVCITITWRDV